VKLELDFLEIILCEGLRVGNSVKLEITSESLFIVLFLIGCYPD